MSFDARKKKSWSNKSGVSEIIGNILILMITVVLFSSIMAFVQNMPMPEQLVKATFSAGITFNSDGSKANLTITHAGGASMQTAQTLIIVDQDSTSKGFNLTKDPSLNNALVWKTGMTWSKQLLLTKFSSVIIVTVVDLVKHTSVWTSQVTGGTGQNPPIIGQRYTDSNNVTPTPDPVLEWNNFSFYVRITDPDNDLNRTPGAIWINTQQLQGSAPQYAKRAPQSISGDLFRWDFWNVRGDGLSAQQLDGAIIVIHAEDTKHHAAESTFVMSITKLPVNNVPIPPANEAPADQGSGDSGMPYYMDNRFDNFGWVILGEKKNKTTGVGTGQADTTDKRNNFTKDERVFIRVASTTGSTSTLNNLMGANALTVMNSGTGMFYTPNYTGNSNTYPPRPFYGIPYSGNAYLYECQFTTFGLPPGGYALSMLLKNTPGLGKPQVTFSQPAPIDIAQTGNPITFSPAVTMFKLPNYTGLWGAKTTPFAVSSADQYKIYARVFVQDAVYPPSPSCTEIRIVDMTGSAELFGVPPAGQMISQITRLDGRNYSFAIDLRMSNGAQWRSGTNSYTLVITKLNDTNEGMYSLATQVYITGAGARADFITGTTGMGTGNGNFLTLSYLFYTENNNLFTTRTLWQYENTPNSKTDYTVTALAAGDVNGDGHKDLLMGQAYSNSLILFTNTLDTFGTWQSASVIYRPDGTTNQINCIAFGDVTGDGHDDFAYATAGSPGTIVIYNTTYGSRGWIYNPPSAIKWTGTVTKLALKDMTGDGLADLVVLAGGTISVYDLKYSYNPALKSQQNPYALFKQSTGTSIDFDVADINNDTHPDIVTADTTVAAFTGGQPGVNVNYYTAGTGTLKTLDTSYNSVGYKVISGTWKNGTIAATQAIGGSFISFQENGTSGGQSTPLSSSVKVTMRFQTLSTSPDQLLRVRAKIGDMSGNPTPGEVFYVWYSIDDMYYTPVITVDKTAWTTYQYALPSSVMGLPIYIRVTDSWTTDSGAYTTFIMIDHIGVYTDLFAGYTGVSVVGDTTRVAVKGAFIDGPMRTAAPYMEIVAAKEHRWDVYKWTGALWQNMTGQPKTDATMFTRPGTPGAGYADALNGLAPTLFRAADINGDGYTDILVTNYTTTNGDNSFIGYYLNLYTGSSTYWRYFPVTQWLMPFTGSDPNAWVDIVLAVNLNG